MSVTVRSATVTDDREQVAETAAYPGTPNPARVYDALLGGNDNLSVDREVAARLAAARPALLANVRANRRYLGRVTRYLAAEAGIRQFLDLGTGLPNQDNTHEVAQRAAPDARVVYVDNDPVVIARARALLAGAPDGSTDYLDEDIRDPDIILARAARTLDFTKPVAVMLLGVLYMIPDADRPYEIVAALKDAVPRAATSLSLTRPATSTRRQLRRRPASTTRHCRPRESESPRSRPLIRRDGAGDRGAAKRVAPGTPGGRHRLGLRGLGAPGIDPDTARRRSPVLRDRGSRSCADGLAARSRQTCRGSVTY